LDPAVQFLEGGKDTWRDYKIATEAFLTSFIHRAPLITMPVGSSESAFFTQNALLAARSAFARNVINDVNFI
jgi:hypothetical protein